MSQEPNTYSLFENRINAAWKGLRADVKNWQNSLPEDTAIQYHMGQFNIFCEEAYKRLLKDYRDGGWKSVDKEFIFRSLVIGALTSQWILLRQIAYQRLKGNPYQKDLKEFDQLAGGYYYRLLQALPEKTREQLPPSPPLVYLGPLAELTLFSQRAPAVLSVPFGAPYEEEDAIGRSVFAIPHEVGHAVFERLSGFLPELKCQLLPEPKSPVLKVIMNWLDEIVADLVGTALAGPAFAQSALWVTDSPDDMSSITDEEHPPSLIRPYTHLEALNYLARESAKYEEAHAAEIKAFNDKIKEVVRPGRLNRRFESTPALTVVSLKTVRDEMVKVIRLVLTPELKALGDKSLGKVLVACADTDVALPEWEEIPDEKWEWGEISDEESKQFALHLPEHLGYYATPAPYVSNICCWLRLHCCTNGG